MRVQTELQQQVESLFERCPELWGFSVRSENDELFVSDVGIAPRLSAEQYGEIFQDIAKTLSHAPLGKPAEQYGEIFQDIAKTLSDVLEEAPEASEYLRGRTFARTLH